MIKNNVIQGGGAAVECSVDIVSSTDPFGDSSLIAKYEVESDGTDTTGNYDGTAAAAVTYTTGKYGNCAVFNGVTGTNIDIPSLPITNFNFSMSFFINTTQTASNYIIDISLPCKISFGRGLIASNTYSVYIFDGVAGQAYTSTSVPQMTDGNFHHVCVTHDGSTLIVYLDGVFLASVVSGFTGMTAGAASKIGSHSGGGSAFNGKLDQIEFYDRALTADEVKNLSIQTIYHCDPTPQDYIAYYPLTGTAEDRTGNYDGTENGSLTYIIDGSFGSVMSLDGTNDYISSSLPLGSATKVESIIFWYKSTIAAGSTTGQGLYGDNNGKNQLYVRKSDGLIKLIAGGTQGGDWYNSSIINNTDWHFVEVISNGTLTTLKIDGTQIGQVSTGITVTTITELGRSNLQSLYLTGNMRNFKRYNYELTTEEITTIYDYESITNPVLVDSGLVAYYPLENNSLDNWYQQFDGTGAGGVTYDGTSGSIQAGQGIKSSITGVSTDFSITCWVLPSSGSIGQRIVFMSIGGPTLYLNRNVGSITYSVYTANSIFAHTPVNGTRMHLSLVVSGTSASLYVDSALISTETCTSASFGSGYTFNIGYDEFNNINWLYGLMSHFRVYDRAISPTEVTAIYDAEKSKFGL